MFKRIMWLFLFISFLVSGVCYAGDWKVIEVVATSDSTTFVSAPVTDTRYSESFSLKSVLGNPVGVAYKATSTGTVSLTIQALQSFQKPTTELAADTTYTVWEAPETVIDQQWHVMTLDTALMPYARFKITGTGSNDGSTVVYFRVIKE